MNARTTRLISLEPIAGHHFQPTGFPDLGAATFQRPDGEEGWVEALHVESPQSMANRMELTTWDVPAHSQPDVLEGLPYVSVVDGNGEFVTSSRLEAHRLASAYIMDGVLPDHEGQLGREWLAELVGAKNRKGFDHQRVASAVFSLDPLSLLHGVFFAQKAWAWQPKIARAVTAFIDADDVRPVFSGGVKTDSYDIAGDAKVGYGMVPFQRVEYTARSITAYVTVDHQQIRSYGLGEQAEKLLESLVDFELAHLFGGGLRLRTACDLQVTAVKEGPELPSVDDASNRVQEAIAASRVAGVLGEGATVEWSGRPGK